MNLTRILPSILLLAAALPLAATTYYVSPAGNDLASGKSPLTPWKTVAHVNNSNSFSKGDTIMFLAGGIWREELIPPASGLSFSSYGTGARPIISGANVYTSGWTAVSGMTNVWSVLVGNYQPEQVWFNGVLGSPVTTESQILATNQWVYFSGYLYVYSVGNPGTTYKAPGIEAAQRDSALMIQNISNTNVSNMSFVNPNYTAIDIEPTAAGTQIFTGDLWEGAQYEGLRALGGTQQVVNCEGLYNEVGIGVGGGSGIAINNSILSGNTDGAIEIYGTSGPSTITQSTLTGNATVHPLIATIRNYSPEPLTISKSIYLPNPTNNIASTYIGATDDGTNLKSSPLFTKRAAPLYIVPFIDDYINLGVAQSVSMLAHQYGCTLSYALNTKLVTPTNWQAIAAMVQAGDEVVAHTRSHSDLANNNVFTMKYSGTATQATMSINTSTGRLQTFLNGSSTPDLNVDISNTWNGMTDICSVVTQNTAYSCVPMTNQLYFTPIELQNVSNVNILQPYVGQASSNYLTFEVEGSMTDIEANLPGYKVQTFATPFTSSNQTVEDHIKNAGFASNRNGILDDNDNPNGNWMLSSLDIYNLGAVWIPSGFDSTQPASSAAALVEGMGANGGIVAIYAHGTDEMTIASWQTLFQNLQSFGASCMTMSQATQYIQQHGTLVPDGTSKNWVESVPLTPNFANTSSSPTQGAHGLK